MIQKRLVAKHFSRGAGEYENTARIQRYVASELALKIPLGQYRSILDIGCGTGFLPHLLSQRFPGSLITGIDISPEMVSVAERAKSHKDLVFQLGDGEALGFSDASFDLVVSSSSFQWMDIALAFSEVKRVLTSGGAFCFVCFGRETLKEVREIFGAGSVHLLPREDLIRENLEKLGFEEIEVVSLLKKESYESALELVRTLKKLGVQNAAPRSLGLGGRRNFCKAVVDYHEKYSETVGVYTSYEIIFGMARKKAD